jgi:hypothetical protein
MTNEQVFISGRKWGKTLATWNRRLDELIKRFEELLAQFEGQPDETQVSMTFPGGMMTPTLKTNLGDVRSALETFKKMRAEEV